MKRAIPHLVVLLSVGCAHNVERAPKATISKLRQHSVKPESAEIQKGQIRLLYPWKLAPGTILRVPMQTKLGIPCISGGINEQTLPLILDTGNAFPVLLDATSAAAIEVPSIVGASATGTGIGGNVDVLMTRYDSLEIGGKRILGRGIAGVFLHTYKTTFAGVPVREMPLNLLGLPLLKQFSFVSIDGPREEVSLGFQRPFQAPPGAVSIPFTVAEERLWITLNIHGKSVRAFFDTGCASGLRLPLETVNNLPAGALNQTRIRKRKALGVGGIETEHVGELHSVHVCRLRIEPLEFDTSAGASEALLGWNPFRKNKITIDFVQKQIWVEPNP